MSLGGKNFKDIKFLTKFLRIFPQIKSIDFGTNDISANQQELGEQLKLNKYIRNIEMKKKKGVDKDFMKLMNHELKKNQDIFEVGENNPKLDVNSQYLKLKKVGEDFSFLPKMISEFKCLQILDMSGSDLSQKAAVDQVCLMIDENQTINEIRLRDCKLNGASLTKLAGALCTTNNTNLTRLDFSENRFIQDPQLKVLFGLL